MLSMATVRVLGLRGSQGVPLPFPLQLSLPRLTHKFPLRRRKTMELRVKNKKKPDRAIFVFLHHAFLIKLQDRPS